MIINNENENLSRYKKRRIERKYKMDDNMKSILDKIKSEKKNIKFFDKIKELEFELVKIKSVNKSNILGSKLKELNEIHVIDKNLNEIKSEIIAEYAGDFELVAKLSIDDQIRVRFGNITD